MSSLSGQCPPQARPGMIPCPDGASEAGRAPGAPMVILLSESSPQPGAPCPPLLSPDSVPLSPARCMGRHGGLELGTRVHPWGGWGLTGS